METPFEELANAIVVRAAKDYRLSMRALSKNPKSSTAQNAKKSVLIFFKSEWCRFLCGIDGMMIIDRINEEEKL